MYSLLVGFVHAHRQAGGVFGRGESRFAYVRPRIDHPVLRGLYRRGRARPVGHDEAPPTLSVGRAAETSAQREAERNGDTRPRPENGGLHFSPCLHPRATGRSGQ